MVAEEQLRKILKKKGISLKDLAVRLDSTPQALTKILNGNPTEKNILTICKAININVGELYDNIQNTPKCIELQVIIDGKPINIQNDITIQIKYSN